MEIQNQDSHFSTAQNRLRRKENNSRLHKTLDAPVGRPAWRLRHTIETDWTGPTAQHGAPNPLHNASANRLAWFCPFADFVC